MNFKLIDKLDLDNTDELIKRDSSFRITINNKIYDTSHEDDLVRYIVNDIKWRNMLLIRYEYYLSKTYHGLGKGDLVFYDTTTLILYVIELKSLKDKYSNITDASKIEKCTLQSINYASYAKNWAHSIMKSQLKIIPVSVIEYLNGDIVTNEHKPCEQIDDNSEEEILIKNKNPWTNNNNGGLDDKWFTHPGDQTNTRYRIVNNRLEAERIVDQEPSSGSRKHFRKRVQRVAAECTTCTEYFIIMKNLDNDILMNECRKINDNNDL